MKTLSIMIVVLAAACASPRYANGPVRPATPGPIDLLRSTWGDYGGRCPGDYKFCKGEGQDVCCPLGTLCAEDAGGAYCGSRDADVRGRASAADAPVRCESGDIVCSYRGRTTCCASDQRCCTIDGSPRCCS